MNESRLSESVERLLRDNVAMLHATMAQITQAVVAERSGMSPTTISRMLSGKEGNDDIERVLRVVAACNLQLVPMTYTAIDPDELRATRLLARRALDDVARAG